MQSSGHDEFQRAVAEFNDARYFECHDTLEALWAASFGTERTFLQGLIQVAVGFYHSVNGNPSGALSQWEKGRRKLESFVPAHRGIDVAGLLEDVSRWSAAAVRTLAGESGPAEQLPVPTLEITYNSQRREPWPR